MSYVKVNLTMIKVKKVMMMMMVMMMMKMIMMMMMMMMVMMMMVMMIRPFVSSGGKQSYSHFVPQGLPHTTAFCKNVMMMMMIVL